MFEDNPPPLPTAMPATENLSDVALADLDDDNRLTAVADEDSVKSNDETCSRPSSRQAAPDIVFDSPELPCSDVEPLQKMEYGNMSEKTGERKNASFDHAKGLVNGESTASTCDCEAFEHNNDELFFKSLPESADVSRFSIDTPDLSGDEQDERITKVKNYVSVDLNKIDLEEKFNQNTVGQSDFKEEVVIDVSLHTNKLEKAKESDKEEIVAAKTKVILDSEKIDLANSEIGAVSSFGDVPTEVVEQVDDCSFDEFGDFAESSIIEPSKVLNEEIDKGSWVAEVSESAKEEQEAGADNWTADFQVAYSSSSTNFTGFSSEESNLPSLEKFFGDSLWQDEDLLPSILPKNDNSDIIGVVEELNTVSSRKDSLNNCELVWLDVSIIEEALALKFQWPSSSTYLSFLDSLNVDLKMASVDPNLPAFAQHLSDSDVLQPTSSSEPRKPGSNALPQNARVPTLENPKAFQNVVFDSLAVPPVQFDWNHSGLTNPLTSGSISASSALMDLECLTTNDPGLAAGKSYANDVSTTLQKDLAALGLDITSSNNEKLHGGPQNSKNKSSSLFDQIMKKETKQQKYVSTKELSLDAKALHDQLPDLDYMLSNVLLFPMTNH